ncbi:MAG: MaoC family dehydratase N-terminal domain-containing protein [Candidatus Lokiarchaeota archaeon]|nr:MaoC family dehydratase N-terminal domain-containing protein [Candidatus Lokiarchaeota archaeon]
MVQLSELKVGTELRYVYGPVTRDGIIKYAFASGDRNNIHTNDEFAEKMGLKGVIAHGLYSLGMVARCLGEIASDKGKVVKLSGQMRGMVRPGDEWIITLTVKKINGDLVDFDFVEESKTLIKIEKDGVVIKKYEAEERGWVSEKDIAQNLIKTEEVAEGILHYRLRTAIPGTATIKMV